MRHLFASLILVSCTAYADMDQHSQNALKQTQELLTNANERQKAVNADPQARETDAKVDALAGNSANKERIYNLAAQVMEKITAEAGGDPAKMQALLNEAQKDPQGFYNKMFSESEKRQLQDVSRKIEKNRPSSSPKN